MPEPFGQLLERIVDDGTQFVVGFLGGFSQGLLGAGYQSVRDSLVDGKAPPQPARLIPYLCAHLRFVLSNEGGPLPQGGGNRAVVPVLGDDGSEDLTQQR